MAVKESLGARRHIGNALEAVDGTAIRVHPERCAKVRNRNVACLKCADACTSGCIALVDGELAIDQSRCVGCGTCATVCPTCALESLNPSDAELHSRCLRNAQTNSLSGQAGATGKGASGRAAQGPAVTLVCHPLAEALEGLLDPSAVAEVVCAGRVDESLLVGLAAEGVRAATVLCGRCDRCAQRHGRDTAEKVAATAAELLRQWDGAMEVAVQDELPREVLREGVAVQAAEEALRLWFAVERGNEPVAAAALDGAPAAGEGGAAAPSGPLPPAKLLSVMKDGTLPHFIPDRRERLLDALALLGEPRSNALETRLWGTVVIDGTRCVSCRMCATFCPTGAIAKFDADDAMGVEHRPGDCVKCGSCADICPADAITILDAVNPQSLMDGAVHRYRMDPRPVALKDNPHQILDTMRQSFNGDIFER